MKSLRLHLSFIWPLFIVCSVLMLLGIIKSSLDAYERALGEDYAVVIVAAKPLKLQDLGQIKDANRLEKISAEPTLERIKTQLSSTSFAALKSALPHFYSLNFKRFISLEKITSLKQQLEKLPEIKRVEIFSKTHSKVFHMLVLLKAITLVFAALIALLCWQLYARQITLWRYEHAERIYILELFGASFFGRCGFMLRMIFADCIIVYLLCCALFYGFFNYPLISDFYAQLDAPLPEINIFIQLAFIVGAALVCSFFAAFLVLKRR